jgi:ATP-dependent Clp protease adapter protein ClpS
MSTLAETSTISLEDVYAHLWYVTVLNDDVTPFSLVEFALMSICGHTREAAHALTSLIHNEGRAVVAVSSKEEEALLICAKLTSLKIQAIVTTAS